MGNQLEKETTRPYLTLARQLFTDESLEKLLPAKAAALPRLTLPLLETLVAEAKNLILSQPRLSWAIMAVADAAAPYFSSSSRKDTLFLQALAAWQLARAANAWLEPQRAETAVSRAEITFTQLGRNDWLAACTWQRHAVPWLSDNFPQAVAKLTQTLEALSAPHFEPYLPDCRFSLAQAHILAENFDLATSQLDQNKQYFAQREDQLGQWYYHILNLNLYRRQGKTSLASEQLEKAQAIAAPHQAPVYQGLMLFYQAYLNITGYGHLQEAVALFQEAMSYFRQTDLRLMEAQCYNGLYQAYSNLGQLKQAADSLNTARGIYKPYQIPGLLADNLLEHGRLAMYTGKYAASLTHFEEAEMLYRQVGHPSSPALSLMNQGEALLYQGQYERAIALLEQAEQTFQALERSPRLLECKLRLAVAWLNLGQIEVAQSYLTEISAAAPQQVPINTLAAAYHFQALLYFRQGNFTKTIDTLQNTLELLTTQDIQPQIALAQRLLAEAWLKEGNLAQACGCLQLAEGRFKSMGMELEQTVCQLTWGYYYQQIGATDLAHAAWEAIITSTQPLTPDITWPAYAALAELAVQLGQTDKALQHYEKMMVSLTSLRQQLWQPALVGSFLQRPIAALDKAICLAAQEKHTHKALSFMEQSKAQSFLNQLLAAKNKATIDFDHDDLLTLKAEIQWLYDQLRVVPGATMIAHREQQATNIKKLQAHLHLFERHLGQQKRSTLYEQVQPTLETFDLSQFRQLATDNLVADWVALNYYVTAEQLNGVMITPTTSHSWTQPIMGATARSIHLLARQRQGRPNLAAINWQPVAKQLFPPFVRERLTPSTLLLIAPHRQLHQLPWAILPLDDAQTPLVACAIPTITPSFSSLLQIWRRPKTAFSVTKPGLVLTLAHFQPPTTTEENGGQARIGRRQRWEPLPEAKAELEAIQPHLPPKSRCLINEGATWSTLSSIGQARGFNDFSVLHCISHAFHDSIAGYASGLALYDQDVWLDELETLAPLPPLVTLSVCSGNQLLLHEGDEAIGLPVSCLAAGAQSVVGSLWLVSDMLGRSIMPDFYQYLSQTEQVAHALALAQRSAWQRGKDRHDWGGFLCFGSA